ncbi:MAG TPA: hypothetical protein VFX56_09095, partial [Nitrospira sp.]|nr:hypothetical protein [Nitrospira sp.]
SRSSPVPRAGLHNQISQSDNDTLGVLSAYMQAICEVQIACGVFPSDEQEESKAERKEQPWITPY